MSIKINAYILTLHVFTRNSYQNTDFGVKYSYKIEIVNNLLKLTLVAFNTFTTKATEHSCTSFSNFKYSYYLFSFILFKFRCYENI